MSYQITSDWSRQFGLAHAFLFEANEVSDSQNHAVLLDGGPGSFVLSVGEEPREPKLAASWAWSSGLPNHVKISNSSVIVTRWDAPEASETFTLASVTQRLDIFYKYLAQRRVFGRRDVTVTLLNLFRAVRGEVNSAGADDEIAIVEFLEVLAHLVARERRHLTGEKTFPEIWHEVRPSLGVDLALTATQREKIETGFHSEVSAALSLTLSTILAIRHAGGAIFQEAHFLFRTSNQYDLFGYQPRSTVSKIDRGTHHFTPAPLARCIVEQALTAMKDVEARARLVVVDPACGSGAILVETIRALRRIGFKGNLKVVGRDLSRPAVYMAQFALQAAKCDWVPEGGLEIDVQVADSLAPGAIPEFDLVVMNPPFLAWPMMDKLQKAQVHEILGEQGRHRPDLSMAFVSRVLESGAKNSVVASLMPSSILQLSSGLDWRRHLLTKGRLAFLGSFGDYGLFVHAMVQVAAIVLAIDDDASLGVALKAANESAATGEALRALRRLHGEIVSEAVGAGWRIAPIDKRDLVDAHRWRILPGGNRRGPAPTKRARHAASGRTF